MKDSINKKEALRMMAENPVTLLDLFNFSRKEVLEGLCKVGMETFRKELGGNLWESFPLAGWQASIVAGGADRKTLLKHEHIKAEGSVPMWTVKQALAVKSRNTKNLEEVETAHEKVIRLRRELEEAEEALDEK